MNNPDLHLNSGRARYKKDRSTDWSFLVVELVGFEPTTSSMPSRRASQLRHSPLTHH